MHGSFSDEALEQFAQLAAQTQAADFAEGDTYDFTRCVRPDGTAYGTRGKCRKGAESGPAEKPARRPRAAIDTEGGAPVAPVPPKERNPKAVKPKFASPYALDNARQRYIKNHPEVREHMDTWRQYRGNMKTVENEAKELKKKGDMKGYQEALYRVEKHEREMVKAYDRAGRAAKKANREFNKLYGVKKSKEERELEKRIKAMG
jgi:hypothetical protein